MNYKNIMLAAFLLPVTITSYGQSVETRIQKLKEAQFQKELELSEIGEMIDKKCDLLTSYKSNAFYYWKHLQEKKINELQEKNKLSKEDCEKAIAGLEILFEECLKNIGTAFDAAKDIKRLIQNELFDTNGFENLRLALLRVVFEQHLIEKLIVKYEACIQELIIINKELISLKK